MEKVAGVTAQDDQKFMETYASRLKKKLAGIVDPEVDCDSPKVLFNMLEKGDVKYLVVINDNRTYDERVGQYKAVLGKLLPQSTRVRINGWDQDNLFAYDMLERRPLEVRSAGGAREFSVQLTELGGKVIALYPHKLGALAVHTAKTVTPGASSVIRIHMRDDGSAPLAGLQPLDIRITDAEGKRNEFSGYYCAKDGILDIDFVAALNDKPGQWTVSATDLTTGLMARGEFEVGR